MPEPFAIERITSLDRLLEIRDLWQDLLRRDPNQTLFLSFEMFLAWWRAARDGASLFVLLLTRGRNPVGIAPLALRQGRVRRIPSRYLTLFVPRSDFIIPEDRPRVVEAILQYCGQSTADWDAMVLDNVPEYSGTPRDIEAGAARVGLRVVPAGASPSESYLSVQGTWEEYLAGRTKHFRKRLRQQCHLIERLGRIKFRTYRRAEDIDRAFEALADLENRSWKAAAASRLPAAERACFMELARNEGGAIQYEVCFLELEEHVVAGLFSLVYAGRLYAFVTYYDQRVKQSNPGRPLFREVLQEAFARPDVREVSFIGNYPFAALWTPSQRRYGRLRVYNSRLRSRVLSIVQGWAARPQRGFAAVQPEEEGDNG